MPPLPPVQPLPQQLITSYNIEFSPDGSDPRASRVIPPTPTHTRPMSVSFSSIISGSTTLTADSIFTNGGRSKSTSFSTTITYDSSGSSPANMSPPLPIPTLQTAAPTEPLLADLPIPPHKRFTIDRAFDETLANELLPVEQFMALSERSLAMHLYFSYQGVLACQEAMWEELKDRLRNRKDELKPFGWEDDEELEELHNRKRFERLIERYRG